MKMKPISELTLRDNDVDVVGKLMAAIARGDNEVVDVVRELLAKCRIMEMTEQQIKVLAKVMVR